jgi:hypothetical protein
MAILALKTMKRHQRVKKGHKTAQKEGQRMITAAMNLVKQIQTRMEDLRARQAASQKKLEAEVEALKRMTVAQKRGLIKLSERIQTLEDVVKSGTFPV